MITGVVEITISRIFRHWTAEQRPEYQPPYESREALYVICRKLKVQARDEAYAAGHNFRHIIFDWPAFRISGDTASVPVAWPPPEEFTDLRDFWHMPQGLPK